MELKIPWYFYFLKFQSVKLQIWTKNFFEYNIQLNQHAKS